MITQRLYDQLIDRYLRGATVTELAEWCGINRRTLWRLLKKYEEYLLQAPRALGHWRELTHIGIDELFWRGRILGVVVNLATGELLDLLPDRQIATVVASLRDIKTVVETLRGQSWQPVVVTDMWDDYRTAVQQVFQDQALHVTDRFHLQTKISEDLIEVVRTILPVSRQRPLQIRMIREAFHRSEPHGEWMSRLSATESQKTQLTLALQLALELKSLWGCADQTEARELFAHWRWMLVTQKKHLPVAQPFGRLTYLFQLWERPIFNYFDPKTSLANGKKATGAISEAVNAKIRLLEKRSRRHSFDHFGEENGREQQHFEAFWLAAMHTINVPLTQHQPLQGTWRPASICCPNCQQPVETVTWESTHGMVRDVPLGDHPVTYHLEDAHWRCTECHQTGVEKIEASARWTPDIAAYIKRQRNFGWSVRQLSVTTGLSRSVVRRLCTEAEQVTPVKPMPTVLGIQTWRWRKRMHWVLTDAEHGTLIDIMPAEKDVLLNYLSDPKAIAVQVYLLASLNWKAQLPQTATMAVDRFTAVLPVQEALREVQRRYTDSLSVAARRQPAHHRHRLVILQSPKHQSAHDLRRLTQWLYINPELRTARKLRDEYLSCLDPSLLATQSLQEWLHRARLLTAGEPTTSIQRALHFGFRDACNRVEQSLPLIVRGQQMANINLGSSRVLLRHLKEHRAARQPDFAVLRQAALREFE